MIQDLTLKARARVHTTPENFENAALFLRLDLPFTLIRHENGASFSKRLFKPEEFGKVGLHVI